MPFQNRVCPGRVAVAVLAIVLFLGAAALLFRDVYSTYNRPGAEPASITKAREDLKIVGNTANGWFPYKPNSNKKDNDPVYDWESDPQNWMLENENPLGMSQAQGFSHTVASDGMDMPPGITETKRGPGGKAAPAGKLTVSNAKASHGKKALAVPVRFPDPVTIFRANPQSEPAKMVGVRFIAYDVYVPSDCRGFVGCLFFLKDKDGLWYQARSRASLLPGQWTTVTADIRGGSPDVTPLGHQGQWDDNQATQIKTLGLTFYGDKEFTGNIYVDNFRGWVRASRVQKDKVEPAVSKAAENYKEPALRVLNLRTEPFHSVETPGPTVAKFETFTVRFELNRQVDNPFDPAFADITCEVATPSGKKQKHYGFWYQDYDRTDRFSGDDLAPIGRPEWRIRITPREEGTYTYTVNIDLKGDKLTIPARTFTAGQSKDQGFIRVSKKDPHFFEFENGDFYYPIGHNLHSPVDMRCWQQILKSEAPAGRGLPMYADFFPKMKAAGENVAEVWMASWWLGIEWTNKWRNFYGAGRYSLQNAWKLDRLLEMAQESGIHVHLVLDNHGKFSTYCDWEWDLNPYNISEPLGVCNGPRDYFSDPRAKTLHKNKLRYIAARWGPDPTIMGFELVSEFDLVGGNPDPASKRSQGERRTFHKTPLARGWVREMIQALKTYDVYDHVVSNHYATDYNWVDAEMAKEAAVDGSPLFDYIVTDAYRQTQPMGYVVSARSMQKWYNGSIAPYAQKPFWITEYGGDFNGATETSLDSDVHCGLWATWMTEGGGTPLMWWFDFIDQRNHYPYYAAFSKFVAGEDRRGLQGAPGLKEGAVGLQWYKWPTGAYAWAFDSQAMMSMPPVGSRPKHTDIQETITGLQPGKYKVEFWDTYEGTVVETRTVDVTSRDLKITFPPFVNDMAVKVKLIK